MPEVVEFTLNDTFESSIEPILKCLDHNPPRYERVHIKLVRNTGGELPPVLVLIDRIQHSDPGISISVSVDRYVFSAAAVLYFSLVFGKVDGSFKNVELSPLTEPILVLFHKPRKCEGGGEFIRFEDETQSNSGTGTAKVGRVFRRFLDATGYSEIREVPYLEGCEGMKHKNQHILDAWNNNYDCIFPWDDTQRSPDETQRNPGGVRHRE